MFIRLHECKNLNRKERSTCSGTLVCSVVTLVVVQPGDQLLSPERRTSAPRSAREDGVDSDTQSESQARASSAAPAGA